MDFYAADSSTDIPEHVGFCYILQNNLLQSAGMATVPITNSKHLAIGQLKGTTFQSLQQALKHTIAQVSLVNLSKILLHFLIFSKEICKNS